ncbi:phosphate ABC transporter permease PstA [Thioflexithrix psekupsensis]|nr:phosphate ABC transporter permease PstA [Thioflexithrix psekupsensis]
MSTQDMSTQKNIQRQQSWWGSGDPWIWLTSSAVTISVIVVFSLLTLIAVRGLGHFWPSDAFMANYKDDKGNTYRLIGEVHTHEKVPADQLDGLGYDKVEGAFADRYLVKTGNRELVGLDFRWIVAQQLTDVEYPETLMVLERRKGGNFYGFLRSIKESGQVVAEGHERILPELWPRLERAQTLYLEINRIERHEIGRVNYALEQLRLAHRRLELRQERTGEPITAQELADLETQREVHDVEFQKLSERLGQLYQEIDRDSITAEVMDGQVVEIPLANVVYIHFPNAMGVSEKLSHYFMKLGWFVSKDPREANTEGGVFPAIFGTVMMVFVMSIIVTPFGVIAAVYLREYAKQGFLTRTIRIAVNNLAGVPSIVYGVFGLGFFVYFLGGTIDQLFYPEALPAPTFGSGGILWAALTLAILTLPVVIVSTEEGLSRIPSSIREGSLALGATKAETLWRTILPMASPAIMTGLILAIARAAGEVAPLMLVGVVKLAPSLVLDGNYPFLHLERKFMHLGFHIYDIGFQSPNVEAVRPLVYATSFLLVAVIIILNIVAIWIRNHLREKYKSLESA